MQCMLFMWVTCKGVHGLKLRYKTFCGIIINLDLTLWFNQN